jgi:hypothetical protein
MVEFNKGKEWYVVGFIADVSTMPSLPYFLKKD